MPPAAQDDDEVMKLVEDALKAPPEAREQLLKQACHGNAALFQEAWNCVLWEQRMGGFLRAPIVSLPPEREGEHPFRSGDLLDGRFRIVREVAQGGMGIVYEAQDTWLDRRIALKCAKQGFGKGLPPEVRNATEISHPNVCKIFEIHTAGPEHGHVDFLTMEFLEGETLSERLKRGPFTADEATIIALQLCAGLAEAHGNKVIHGDLKSNNVILAKSAGGRTRAVITDFGLARRPESSGQAWQSGQLVGTPNYMAPELWKGAKASVASDIYALGIILRELIGQQPSRKWERAIQRCLHSNPEMRFRRADDLGKALAPRSLMPVLLSASLASVLAIASGFVTYETAKAPVENIRLAVDPFTFNPGARSLANGLPQQAGKEIAKLKGNARMNLRVVPPGSSPTHILRGAVTEAKGKLAIHAVLTDARSGVNAKEWKAEYSSLDTRHIPVALAGVVRGALHLPADTPAPAVNAAAWKHYYDGLASLRSDSGIDSGVAALELAVAADSDTPLTHAALAEAQWLKYSFSRDPIWLDRATLSFKEAARRNPDLGPVRRVSGILLQNGGFHDQAIAEYARAIEVDPKDGDSYRRLARVHHINGRLDEALAAYKRATDIDPTHYRNYQALGNFYFERADYAEAIRNWKKTIELAPAEPEGHIVLASAYLNVGELTEAEKQIRSALALAETPRALHTLGLILMYQRQYQQAIPYLRRAIKLWPDRHLFWTHLASCYRHTGSAAQAAKASRLALELVEKEVILSPRDGRARSGLAYVCASLGDRRRAESEAAQALSLTPHDAHTRWWAVLTYEVLRKRDATLSVLGDATPELIADLNRWPELADLQKDSRFIDLLRTSPNKKLGIN